jgi:hypothetical protein
VLVRTDGEFAMGVKSPRIPERNPPSAPNPTLYQASWPNLCLCTDGSSEGADGRAFLEGRDNLIHLFKMGPI